MENHGTVVGGKDLSDAFMRFETLEFCSRTIIKAQMIGNIHSLNQREIKQYEEYDSNLPEFDPSFPSDDELLIRHEMIDIIQRACRQGLMISSYGTISSRLNKNKFIISPTNVNRRYIQAQDLVLIKNGKRENGKRPSKAVKIHNEIYSRHPEIQCIISTQSPYATAFCVSHIKMDTRTIPESYVLLEDIPMIPYEGALDNGDIIADTLSKHTPIVLLKNDSILATGGSLLETFDRLEVAEFSAKSLIDSTAIGELQPIKKEELLDLRKKFLND
jgi:L-fuculose-phosphate aldolase